MVKVTHTNGKMTLVINTSIFSAHVIEKAGKGSHLHGHNWDISVEIRIDDAINVDKYVVDVKRVKSFIDMFDHKTIFPRSAHVMSCIAHLGPAPGKPQPEGFDKSSRMVIGELFKIGTKNYLLPRVDIATIEVPHVTMENVAKFFAGAIGGFLKLPKGINEAKIIVKIAETKDNFVVYEHFVEYQEEDEE